MIPCRLCCADPGRAAPERPPTAHPTIIPSRDGSQADGRGLKRGPSRPKEQAKEGDRKEGSAHDRIREPPMCWCPPTGWRSTSTIRPCERSRSTRTRAPTTRVTSAAPSRGTGRPISTRRWAGTTSTGPASRRPALRRRGRPRHHGRPVRRQQQLVRGVRVLAAEAPRVRRREAAQRGPQEVGAREPGAPQARSSYPETGLSIDGSDRPEIRALRDEVLEKGTAMRR